MKTQLFIACLMVGLLVVAGSLAFNCPDLLKPSSSGTILCKKITSISAWAGACSQPSHERCADGENCALRCLLEKDPLGDVSIGTVSVMPMSMNFGLSIN